MKIIFLTLCRLSVAIHTNCSTVKKTQDHTACFRLSYNSRNYYWL